MAKRRTKADRERERYEADRREWERFRPRLEAAQTLADALRLAADTPRSDEPGRRYYSNLSFFLQTFIVPDGSSHEERALYLQLVRRLDATGVLKPGAGEKIQDALRRTIEAKGNS
jgi:hypothetical protein